MRVVLDTNVLLSAFATRGLCEALLEVCLHSQEIVLSDYILHEVSRHLTGKLRMNDVQARAIERTLRESAEIVEPIALPSDACPDPDDLPVLGTALAGRADVLVTGDAALLAMEEFEGFSILSPRAFYDRLT